MAKGNLVKFTAFQSEDEAIAMLESLRWPNGAACPHCGGADPYRLTARNVTPGKRAARPGLWKCRACRKQFTVKVGTIFESSHIPVSKWLSAIHLISASKSDEARTRLLVTYTPSEPTRLVVWVCPHKGCRAVQPAYLRASKVSVEPADKAPKRPR